MEDIKKRKREGKKRRKRKGGSKSERWDEKEKLG